MLGARHHIRAAWAVFSGGDSHFMDVILHLGAHRTSTTTLQTYLENNRDNLNEIGTEFWGPNRTRSGLFSGLVKNPGGLTSDDLRRGDRSSGLIRMEMGRLDMAGVKSLVVSEENMIGVMRDNLVTEQLYPDARVRLDRFSETFGFRCRRVVITIRSYDKYWASVLAFMVQRGWEAPDTPVLDRLVTQPRSWRDVISDIASVFPAAELIVLPFEGFAGQPDSQLALLNNGAVPASMRGRRDWHNASAGCAKLHQVLLDRGDVRQAARIPNDYSRWQPFEPDQIETLRARYIEDIAWLQGGADGIATYVENSNSDAAGIHLRPQLEERGHFHDQEERSVG